MRAPALALRTFTPADQVNFAALSGDANPLHLDPVAARRTPAGTPVVHGIHALLWALETLAAGGQLRAPIGTIKAQFRSFIPVGAPVALQITKDGPDALTCELWTSELAASTIAIAFAPRSTKSPALLSDAVVAYSGPPRPLAADDIPGSGRPAAATSRSRDRRAVSKTDG